MKKASLALHRNLEISTIIIQFQKLQALIFALVNNNESVIEKAKCIFQEIINIDRKNQSTDNALEEFMDDQFQDQAQTALTETQIQLVDAKLK